jgi:hypothetical protein
MSVAETDLNVTARETTLRDHLAGFRQHHGVVLIVDDRTFAAGDLSWARSSPR